MNVVWVQLWDIIRYFSKKKLAQRLYNRAVVHQFMVGVTLCLLPHFEPEQS